MQCDLFIQEGARLGRTPAEVVSTCDITFACVSDPKAAKDVRTPLPSASQVVAKRAGWPPPLLPCTLSECLHVGGYPISGQSPVEKDVVKVEYRLPLIQNEDLLGSLKSAETFF